MSWDIYDERESIMDKLITSGKYIECPECGDSVKLDKYYDEIGLVEINYKCSNCGYHYNWAYGNVLNDGFND